MQSKPLGAFFQSDNGLAHLAEHAARLVRLQGMFEEMAPEAMRRSCRIANLKAGVLVVFAANGAAAVKLKQLSPRFIDEFLKRGVDLTGIEVRSQVTTWQAPARAGSPRELSETARETLGALEAALPQPSPVREALRRLRRCR